MGVVSTPMDASYVIVRRLASGRRTWEIRVVVGVDADTIEHAAEKANQVYLEQVNQVDADVEESS